MKLSVACLARTDLSPSSCGFFGGPTERAAAPALPRPSSPSTTRATASAPPKSELRRALDSLFDLDEDDELPTTLYVARKPLVKGRARSAAPAWG